MKTIFIMPNKSTNPDATLMIVVDEVTPSTDPKTYQYVYVGNINNLPNDILTESSIVNDLTTGGTNKPLSAEQGKVLNSQLKTFMRDYRPIEINGDVTNAPDEEDLTSVEVEGATVLKLKNKAYATSIYSGLGRTYLRKNIVDNVNILTQDMFYKTEDDTRVPNTNTIFIIQYDYDLNNQTITIPENSILVFEGGSLSNGTLAGNNTQIQSADNVIFTSIVIEGTWIVPNITTAWFGDVEQDNKLREVFALQNENIFNTITIGQGDYTVSVSENEGSAIEIKANTKVNNLGHIILSSNNFERYNIFLIASSNVLFSGGHVTGDVDTHSGSTGEWGMGFSVTNAASDVQIESVEIDKCWGDGIYIAGDSKHVTVNYCNIHDCRRQGISVIQAVDVIIHGCNIQDINGTAPCSCIDIEPNSNKTVEKVSITHCTFSNPGYRILILSSLNDTKKINNVLIEGNTFGDSVRAIDMHNKSNTITNISNVTIRSNRLESVPSKGFLMWGVYNLDVSFNNIVCELEGKEPSTTDGVVYFHDCQNAYFQNNNVDSWDNFLKVIGTAPITRDNNIEIHSTLSVGRYTNFENNTLTLHKVLNIEGTFRNNVIIAEEDFDDTRMLQLYENGYLENNVIKLRSNGIEQPVYCRADNIIKDNFFIGDVAGLTFEYLIFLNSDALELYAENNQVENITLTKGLIRNPHQKVRTNNTNLNHIILNKNLKTIDDVTTNYLEQSDLTEANTVYVVQYDYSLGVPTTKSLTFTSANVSSVETPEKATLDSETARYNAALKLYNTAVKEYNDAVAAYEAAVAAYKADPTEENMQAMDEAEIAKNVAEAKKDSAEETKDKYLARKNKAQINYEAIGSQDYYYWEAVSMDAYHALHLTGRAVLLNSTKTEELDTINGIVINDGDTTDTVYIGCLAGTFTYRYDNCIIVPDHCMLKFEGGSIINGTIIGNNTKIESPREHIFNNIRIAGNWIVPEITSYWFTDATQNNVLKEVFALQDDNILNTIIIESGNYTVSIEENAGVALTCLSNLNLIINGNINLTANNFDYYYILYCYGKNHINISGSGAVVGDKTTHTGSTGEWGMGIEIFSSKFVTVKNLKVKDCWGDCIYIGGTNTENIIVDNCDIDNGRRQGISITHGENIIIRNCKIQNVSGTNPQAAIDIETNSGKLASNIQIYNNYINNCTLGIVIYGRSSYTKTGILIENNYINCIWRAIAANGISTCITVKNNEMHSKYCLVDANTIDGSKDNVILFENNMMYQTDIAESPYNKEKYMCAIYACKGDYMFKHNSIITAMPVFYFASGNKYIEDNDIVCPALFYNHKVSYVKIIGNKIIGNVTIPGSLCWFENNYVMGFFRSTVVSSDSSSRIIGNAITHPNDSITRPERYETDVDAWEDYLENGIMLDDNDKRLAISKYNCSNHAWEIFVNSSSPRIYNEQCVLKDSSLLIENNIFTNVALEIGGGKVSKNRFAYKSNFTITGQLLRLAATDFLFNDVIYKGTHGENENVYLVRARKYIGNTFEIGTGSSVKYIMYPGGTNITISDNVVTLPEGHGTNHIVSNILANIKPIYNNKGETSNRPVFPVDERYYIGCQYFDTTLGKIIVWNGNTWVDASGNTIT